MLVVPPGLDDEFLAQPEPGPRTLRLAFLGSWVERKGIDPLVAAASDCWQNMVNWSWSCLARGGARRSCAGHFQVKPDHEFRGPTLASTELAAAVNAAAILFFPVFVKATEWQPPRRWRAAARWSRRTQGLAATFAMARCLLVPFGDPPALARSLRHLAEDPDFGFGRKGRLAPRAGKPLAGKCADA